MNQRQKDSIRRQLKVQAESLGRQDGNELAMSLIRNASVLIRLCIEELDPAGLDEDDLAEVTQFFEEIVRNADQYAGKIPEEGDPATLSGLITEVNRRSRMLHDWEKQVKSLEEQIRSLGKDIRESEEKYKVLEKEKEDLEKEAEKYTDAELEKMSDHISGLKLELARKKAEAEAADRKKEELREKILALQKTIDGFPEREKELLERKKQLEKDLKDLEDVYASCGPEKQQELMLRNDELEKQIKAESEKAEDLRSRIDTNENVLQNILALGEDTAREADGQDERFISQLRMLINAYQIRMEPRRKQMEEIGGLAQALENNIRYCGKMMQKYRGWLDGLETPLQSMIRSLELNPEDTENLRNALRRSDQTVWTLPAIRSRADLVRDTLQELNGLLAACAQAAQEDYKASREAAGGNH